MKKIIPLFLLIANHIFGQSVTISPTIANQAFEVKKLGIGIEQRNNTNIIGLGTYIDNSGAYFQTSTNHSINFTTNNSASQMILLTNGNVGIGSTNPTTKLRVVGNAYVSGNLSSDGMISVGSLTIGNGSTINNFLKVYLPEETIPSIAAKTCSTKNYSASGVTSTDVVTLHIVGGYSGNTAIASVRPLTNSVEVKFCNNALTSSSVQTVDLKFTIIK